MQKLIFAAGIIGALALTACNTSNQDQALSKEIITTEAAPKAIGPYSQAVKAGNTLYCSGQIALDPATGKLVTDDIESETRQVLKNLGAVLRASDMDYDNVVRATVYMTDIENYKRINTVYAEFFSDSKPARAAVQVANLPAGANVEISCIAVK
ncbi:MAG: RidA family protein [Deferribacteres bacterium]|nr:RidA family protein [candidate division KSB1 bacterium]MCB9509543.1 RidA family protein [Deferribacteres bacterium]